MVRLLALKLFYFFVLRIKYMLVFYVPFFCCIAGLGGRILDFNQRLEIAIDVAHGLTYLHMYAGKEPFSLCHLPLILPSKIWN